jgi:photosystem II biogenesis protein Psp29
VNNVRTVSDTKRAFYNLHTRPINSIYRRVVEELLVEVHLLTVNVDFRYDPIYALGVVTSLNRFMQGYRPESDVQSIFNGICRAIDNDPQRYRQDAERLEAVAKQLSPDDLVKWVKQELSLPEFADLQEQIRAIAHNSRFKYSRLFGIGLFTLLEGADPDLVQDEAKRTEKLTELCKALNLPEDKLQKDLDLYRSNLEKMAQARIVMEDLLQAEKKKREERAQAAQNSTPPELSDTPAGEAPTGSGS